MSYQIRKITPAYRNKRDTPQSPSKFMRASHLVKQVSTPCTTDESPQSAKLKSKPSMITVMMAKSTFVQKLSLSSTSWCLFDEQKSKYIGFREKYQRQIASLTKIMTTILCIEFLQSLGIPEDFYVKVTQAASKSIGTTAELKANTWIKIWDLLYGTMLPSGNDAAYLLSEVIGYISKMDQSTLKNLKALDLSSQNTTLHITTFIKMMNKKAEDLKLKDTTFSNAHGLQNAMNISSPKDILHLSMYGSKNVRFRKIMNTDTIRYQFYEELKDLPPRTSIQEIIQKYSKVYKKRWWNTNQLLKKGWEGIKTGQTGAAGSCLSSLKNGIYIVVLNCKDNEARFAETQKIFQWYSSKKMRQSTQTSVELP